MNTNSREGHFDYLEFPATSPESFSAAKRFYKEVFGWSFQEWGSEYADIIHHAQTDTRNILSTKPNLELLNGASDLFKPDSTHPVVYYLRKMGVGADALVTSAHGMREGFWVTGPKDGTAIKVDLLHQKTGDGPLQIMQKKPEFPAHGGTIERLSPTDRAKLISATNWSFTMRINDGGFIEQKDEFPFNPPESGYQATVNYNFQKGQGDWTGNGSMHFQKDFYIKFGSPALYGQLSLETWADSDKVLLSYVINPDGSRNLEPKQGYFPSGSRWTH